MQKSLPEAVGRDEHQRMCSGDKEKNSKFGAFGRWGRNLEGLKIGAETGSEFMRDPFIFLHSSIYS